ncbi:MAG: ABC transporter permease subunit [Clostridiales bacterium]|nr:ABC transporter permease subunit [Clostridiales bacterium]
METNWGLHAMLLPGVLITIVFCYVPMVGIAIAFQNFKPWLGFFNSPWLGLGNFERFFTSSSSVNVLINTVEIAVLKILTGLAVPIAFALLLNEIRVPRLKKTVQTMVYLPHFLSWVILAGILKDVLAVDGGIVNRMVSFFGGDPIFFFGDGNWFRVAVIVSNVWKEFGFSTIVYLAALTAVDTALYEAAMIDGAGRWKQTVHVTLPSIMPIIVVMFTLSLGNVLNAGFDQIYNLYTPMVYDKGDIIDTFVYRTAIVQANMSYGAAVGLFKSVVALVLILVSYKLADKFANYRIF